MVETDRKPLRTVAFVAALTWRSLLCPGDDLLAILGTTFLGSASINSEVKEAVLPNSRLEIVCGAQDAKLEL